MTYNIDVVIKHTSSRKQMGIGLASLSEGDGVSVRGIYYVKIVKKTIIILNEHISTLEWNK